MISIIIRTKNEEHWMRSCLEAVKRQIVEMPFEIVLVDNASHDKTIEKALAVCPNLKLVQIEKFLPGNAINEGIRASSGDYIVCLSAHCIPAKQDWLAQLLVNFENNPDLAGVYGRQLPMSFTSPSDKRDLLITFGLDRRVQYKDPFFHNANSMVPRHVWDRFPFDENITNIEDRLWAQSVLAEGMHIVYEPNAPVYHYHGIHQNNDSHRAESIVRIMEANPTAEQPHSENHPFDPSELDLVALVPVQVTLSDLHTDEVKHLLDISLASIQESRLINRAIVTTNDQGLADYVGGKKGIRALMRDPKFSQETVRVDDVLAHELELLENQGDYPDAIVSLEITHPFRPPDLLDQLVESFFESGSQTVVAGVPEYRPCWVREGRNFGRVDGYLKRRDEREPVHVALPGLGCVTLPTVIRNTGRFGEQTTIFELEDPLAVLEVRSKDSYQRLIKFFQTK